MVGCVGAAYYSASAYQIWSKSDHRRRSYDIISIFEGAENAGVENAGVENARVENAGVDSRGGKCRSGKSRSDNVWKAVRTENS